MKEIVKIKEKVTSLEEALLKLSYEQMNTQISLQQLSKEMKEFKEEMKEFKNEMKEFKNEMIEFKNEMIEFKRNSEEYRKSMNEEIKRMNKQWAELANKMGTFAEDIVAPNIPFVGEKYFNLKEYTDFIVRIKRRKPSNKSQEKEFDTIAIYEKDIILTEVKSTARIIYANEFIDFINNNMFYEYFPEYRDKRVIPIFASLYIDENVLKHLTKNNIFCLAMKGGTMDILNSEIIKNNDL